MHTVIKLKTFPANLSLNILICLTLVLTASSCRKEEPTLPYLVNGRVTNGFGEGIEGVKVYLDADQFQITDERGNWEMTDLSQTHTITPIHPLYSFEPESYQVTRYYSDLDFVVIQALGEKEIQVIQWLNQMQLPNGLLESTENNNTVSLYDNALASMVFMLNGDLARAEQIFDFFDARKNTELVNGVGGFSQFRDRAGIPSNHRWMGDNAWLLIALNNYKALTGSTKYDALSQGITDWLFSLQDSDGGLFAGYGANNQLLNYKVTEGNIDAFNAVSGYTQFHISLLDFLERDRWDATDQSLVAWPGNPTYLYALDCHSWSYCIFEEYPLATLTAADRFITTQTATINGQQVTGFDIDEDKDAVFLEGTGQMALAYHLAGLQTESEYYLSEMEKVLVPSPSNPNTFGFPYASNIGTGYGDTPLWTGADTKIAISSGAWYIFAKQGFNPFAAGRYKTVPVADRFWVN